LLTILICRQSKFFLKKISSPDSVPANKVTMFNLVRFF
jgi:hypothetical protein